MWMCLFLLQYTGRVVIIQLGSFLPSLLYLIPLERLPVIYLGETCGLLFGQYIIAQGLVSLTRLSRRRDKNQP